MAGISALYSAFKSTGDAVNCRYGSRGTLWQDSEHPSLRLCFGRLHEADPEFPANLGRDVREQWSVARKLLVRSAAAGLVRTLTTYASALTEKQNRLHSRTVGSARLR